MPDLATISTVLGSIKTATDIAKLIKDSGSSLEQAEVKLQIAELIGSLADAKIEVAGIQAQLMEKDETIKRLVAELNKKSAVVWDKPYYWVQNEDGKDGPFCQRCYDADQKLIRLQGGGTKIWFCQSCEKTVKDKNYVSPYVKMNRS